MTGDGGDMSDLYRQCAKRLREVSSLAQAAALVSWDQETMMPERATAVRAEQSAALAGVIHEKLVAPEVGEMLRELSGDAAGLSDDERVCVREWRRDYEKATRLPDELVRELAQTTSLAQEAWVKARRHSDFSAFAPWLEKVVDLKRRQAKAYGVADGALYDALLDDYEPRMTVAELDPLFDRLQRGLVPIVEAIRGASMSIDARVLTRRFPEGAQEALAREVMARLGLDVAASRLDRSAHPFCTGIAPTDVRITTRYDERWFLGSLYGVIHETGHALYEQGMDEHHACTPLAEALSLGIHESQSRLWENVVGRSRPFLRFLLPRLRKRFPRQLRGIGLDAFYRAVNRVEASCIRVEADEVTYSLHVVLRYEIEKDLIAGRIAVKDLPSIWNEKMERLLGVRPKNDAEGVLQDVHWSAGLIGYFPTYALGNLYAAQWWRAICKEIRGVESKIAAGQFAPILRWLRKHVHQQGRRYDASELVRRATGEPLRAEYFLEYLDEKFAEIYRIRPRGRTRGRS